MFLSSHLGHELVPIKQKNHGTEFGTAVKLSTILLDLLHVRFEFLSDFFEFRMMQVM